MPTSPILRKDVIRRFMMTHTTGVTAQTPLGQLERMYYLQYLGGSIANPASSLKQLKYQWMRKWISDKSGTAPTQSFESDLWKAMVNTVSGQKAVNSTATNIINFFLNAP